MIGHLALDIETVPVKKISQYSKSVQQKIREKIKRRQERTPDFDYIYFASTHGDFGKIICISLGYIGEDESIHLKSLSGDDEYQILQNFNRILEGNTGLFIHYNGLSFDIPFILQRMAHHHLISTGSRFNNLRRFSNDPHFDLMMAYYNWDMQKSLPLGILAELHGLPSPKEELSGDRVYQAYQDGKWQEIVRYCEYDTATVLNLWWKIFQNQPIIPLSRYNFSDKPSADIRQFTMDFT